MSNGSPIRALKDAEVTLMPFSWYSPPKGKAVFSGTVSNVTVENISYSPNICEREYMRVPHFLSQRKGEENGKGTMFKGIQENQKIAKRATRSLFGRF
jgi:hypothetical protein